MDDETAIIIACCVAVAAVVWCLVPRRRRTSGAIRLPEHMPEPPRERWRRRWAGVRRHAGAALAAVFAAIRTRRAALIALAVALLALVACGVGPCRHRVIQDKRSGIYVVDTWTGGAVYYEHGERYD